MSVSLLNLPYSIILLHICSFFFVACSDSQEQQLPPLAEPATVEFIPVDLRQERFPAAIEVHIRYDHALKQPKNYLAYPMKELWDELMGRYELDINAAQIVFECKDGYLASNSLAELYAAGGGYLAFRDLDAPSGSNWIDSSGFAPFYLVWENVPEDDHSLAWPYGLVKLRIFKSDPYFSLYPNDRPGLMPAFANYKKHCLKCHSLNKLGGDLGPEFNIPKNITEYWTRDNIVEYMTNPRSFRYNSKMYAITGLTTEERQGIVDYLEYMAQHKTDH